MVSFPLWASIRSDNENPLQKELSLMAKLPLFENIPQKGLRLIREQCHLRQFKDEEHIFRYNEPGVGMYIILEGSVRIYSNQAIVGEKTISELKAGDFFGELALLEATPRTASAISVGYSRMLGFFRPDLDVLIKRNPRMMNILLQNIARVTGRRLIATNSLLEETMQELYLIQTNEKPNLEPNNKQ